ncbi:MAG: hypothetical protein ACXABY_00640 [Candidatus Thorarchaeota archaeon]|jgi:hypothetical protein
MASKGWRKVVVDSGEWKWKLGRNSVIARHVETKESRVVDLSALTGLSWGDVERGFWKGGLSITPRFIAAWLNGLPPPQQTINQRREYTFGDALVDSAITLGIIQA